MVKAQAYKKANVGRHTALHALDLNRVRNLRCRRLTRQPPNRADLFSLCRSSRSGKRTTSFLIRTRTHAHSITIESRTKIAIVVHCSSEPKALSRADARDRARISAYAQIGNQGDSQRSLRFVSACACCAASRRASESSLLTLASAVRRRAASHCSVPKKTQPPSIFRYANTEQDAARTDPQSIISSD